VNEPRPMGSVRSVRSAQLEAACHAVRRVLDQAARWPRDGLYVRATESVLRRLASMSSAQKEKYSAATESQRERWTAKAFQEELDRLREARKQVEDDT